ncbi:hypothetical protein [Micromonospora sp. NPDC005806]|uniref:hypothetical protein n=1 Tax=Micromonospora sp. NPDC005806 TaxID=3364234 RepID=UPI00368D1815
MSDNPQVRYGGGNSARVRRRLLAGTALVVLAALTATVALPLLRDRSQQRLERRAEREVTATAQRTRAALLAEPAARETTLRDIADAVAGVEVLTVEAGAAEVRLVFRVRVAKTAASVFGWQRATAEACFAQVVRRAAAPAALERLPCPA